MNNFSWYVYFFSLHVSGDYVRIIRRNNCIYATLGICGWLSDMQGAPCLPDSHPYSVTSTKRRIQTAISPDNGHIVARNM